MELMNCPNLAVPMEVMHHVVRVESSYNPYAIGVVGGHLVRQPKNLAEALATVRMLERKGYNFSLGLAQVNRYNLRKYGLDSYEKAFQACPNLQAGSRILAECYGRSGGNWGKSFSCYYSGDFSTGFQHGYVQKVYASISEDDARAQDQPAAPAIALAGRPSRRVAGVSRFSEPPAPQRGPQSVGTQDGTQATVPRRLPTSRIAAANAPQPYLQVPATTMPEPVSASAPGVTTMAAAPRAVRVSVTQSPGNPNAGTPAVSGPVVDAAFVF